jgi:hypothetical protein
VERNPELGCKFAISIRYDLESYAVFVNYVLLLAIIITQLTYSDVWRVYDLS